MINRAWSTLAWLALSIVAWGHDALAQDHFQCGLILVEGRDTTECRLGPLGACSRDCHERPSAFCFASRADQGGQQRRCGATLEDCEQLKRAEALRGRTVDGACVPERAPGAAVPTPFACAADSPFECHPTMLTCARVGRSCAMRANAWCADSASETRCFRTRSACVEALPAAWMASGAHCELRAEFVAPGAPAVRATTQSRARVTIDTTAPDEDAVPGAGAEVDADDEPAPVYSRTRARATPSGRARRARSHGRGGSVRVRGYFVSHPRLRVRNPSRSVLHARSACSLRAEGGIHRS